MLLNGEDERVGRSHERMLLDGLDDIGEADLGGEGVAVIDYGLSVRTIPAVHCIVCACTYVCAYER